MFLRDFRKTRKRRHFVDDLKPLHIDGWIAQPIRLQHLHHLTNKEASTVLCSVVKRAGSGKARKKCRGKHETHSSVLMESRKTCYFRTVFTLLLSTMDSMSHIYC